MRARNTHTTRQPRRRRGERLWTVAVVISCVCAIAVASSAWLNRARELNTAEASAAQAEQVEIFAVHHELALSFVAEYETALFVDVGVLPRADLEAATSLRRSTVEHPFGTIKAWMGATHFRMRKLKNVRTEMAFHVLAYNIKRMIALVGVRGLLAAIPA